MENELEQTAPSEARETQAENQENTEELKPIEELKDVYDKHLLVKKMEVMIKDDFNKSSKRIDEIRQKIGMPATEDQHESDALRNQMYIELINKRKEEDELKMNELEPKVLELPEGIDTDNPDVQNDEVTAETDELQKKVEGQKELSESELKEAREKGVNMLIMSISKKVIKDFESYLDKAVNKEEAQKMIGMKNELVVRELLEEFIETGEFPEGELKFEAEIKICEHEDENGEKQTFVTGYGFEFMGDGEEEVGVGDAIDGEHLIKDEKEREEVIQDVEAGKEEEKNS